jgi:putative transposase
MKYDPNIHHRRSIRLVGYDYARSGAYFITICTHDRQCIFGDIVDGEMNLNELGNIVRSDWLNLGKHHPNVEIDELVVMPNHLHGIICLDDRSDDRAKSISEIMRGFKTFSARKINKLFGQKGTPIWQRNYYERIVRTEEELENTRNYIINNPMNWHTDINNL